MSKGIFIRAGAILAAFAVVIIIAVSCDTVKNSADNAMVSNPNEVWAIVDGENITRQELWEMMRNVDGINYLFEYVERELLADYIADVTQEEVDAEVELLTYLTENPEKLANIKDDAEVNQDYIDAFEQNLIVLGYDPLNADDVRSYVELGIAKRAYVEFVVKGSDVDSPFYINPTAYEAHYNDTVIGDVCSLDVRFTSSTEATNVFNEMLLVPNYANGFGLYTGTENISTLSKDKFTQDNTEILTSAEVFSKYVELWNYMNPWETPISTSISQEDYCTTYSDTAYKNYDELTEFNSVDDPNSLFATYLFDTLAIDSDTGSAYTYVTSKVFGDFTMLSYKISQKDVPAYSTLEKEQSSLIEDEVIEASITDEVITNVLNDLYVENDLELVDPLLKLKYEFSDGLTYDNDGSTTVVATLNGEEITADDLFDYMTNRVGVFYTLEMAKIKVLINSAFYTEVYGDNHDYFDNNSDKMKAHREALLEMKTNFSANQYVSYGYSSQTMTWNEFLYLAFSLENEEEVLQSMYVVNELQYSFIAETVSYETALAHMQNILDNYFSLNASHILVYTDFDLDFAPDDFSDLIDGFDALELARFNSLKTDLELLLNTKIADGKTFDEIVKEYDDSLSTDDANVWAEFKEYGFFIMTEELGEVDHTSIDALDEEFGLALQRIYETYTRDENKDETLWTDDRIVVSDFGLHFIQTTKGTNFEMETAKFTAEDGDLNDYSTGADNENILPSKVQVELFLQSKQDENNGVVATVNLPNSVNQAVEYYYGDVYNAYFSQTGFSIAMGDQLLSGGVTFTDDNTANTAQLEKLVDLLYGINFPDLFDKDAE